MSKLIATIATNAALRAGVLLTLALCSMAKIAPAETAPARKVAPTRNVAAVDHSRTTISLYTHRDPDGVAQLDFLSRVIRLPSIDNESGITTVSHKVATDDEFMMEPILKSASPIMPSSIATSEQQIDASPSIPQPPLPLLPAPEVAAADEAWMTTQFSPSDQLIELDEPLAETSLVVLPATEVNPMMEMKLQSPVVAQPRLQGSALRTSEADEPAVVASRRLPANMDNIPAPMTNATVTIRTQPSPVEPLTAHEIHTQPVGVRAVPLESNSIHADAIHSSPVLSNQLLPADHLASSPFRHPEANLRERVHVGPGLFERTIIQPDWSRVFGPDCLKCADGLCCCPQSVWTANAELLFLSRSKSDAFDRFLAECNATGDGTRGRDAELDPAYGPRITISRNNLCGGIDFEGVYYQIEDFSGTDSHFGDLVIREVNFLGEGTSFVDYESRLRNAELNASRYVTNWTKLLVGVRWLQIEETASITASTVAFPNYRDQVNIENNMMGGQIGLQHLMWDRGNGFSITGTTKLGILSNEITRDTFGFGTTDLASRQTSLLGELDINAVYQLSRRWSFNAGYQLLAISDVGLALDQFFSPAAIYNDQEALLHGVRLGISFSH